MRFSLILFFFCTAINGYIHFDDDMNSEAGSSPCLIPRTHKEIKGVENGPCGDTLSISDVNTRITLNPGWQTLMWGELSESPPHSLFRVALSQNGVDSFDECVLLDNIPHNDKSPGDSTSYALSINIPDVECPACALQLTQIGFDLGSPCLFADQCPEADVNCTLCTPVFFTCANVAINGTMSHTEVCGTGVPGESDGWPYGSSSDNIYTELENPASWNDDNFLEIDGEFSEPHGQCGETLEESNGDSGSGGISAGTAVGITFAVLFVIIIICGALYFCIRRRNTGDQADMLLHTQHDQRSQSDYIKAETMNTRSALDDDDDDDSRPLPPGWEEFFADDGNPYYYCEATGQTQWERP